ncbi:MAG: AbrB/MazE/SpoVT family DNA-binding domain-containing protein [Bacteroidetes bacterium]|jgi:antitoxin VapB|nr:AbrB/MazE/SpoVT family DNA-binding domain-containing protein [Bacteroidota bacterium]
MKIASINISKVNGSQAITIPDDMKINDDKVYLKKIGNTLHIIPFHNAWQNMIDSIDLFTQDFMENRNQTENQQRESFDQ